ncbi:MAG: hypothetical protein Q9202_001252 [Teloschistes flavicans]
MSPATYERPRRESRRERPSARPRFSSAAAAAAAVVQGDGFKPREERSWEEFHQDLDLETKFPIHSADEVDGIAKTTITAVEDVNLPNGIGLDSITTPGGERRELGHHTPYGDNGTPLATGERDDGVEIPGSVASTPKRKAGRPFRRGDSMLKGIGTPEISRVIPIPGPNPREKLTLPKPSFRPSDPFTKYEQKGAGQLNYVDRSMANVGYQESEIYIRPEKMLVRVTEGNVDEDLDAAPGIGNEGEGNAAIGGSGVGTVEYDMDEQDTKWLDVHNGQRKLEEVEPIKPAIFEITMTKIEKEWHALEKRIPKPNPKPPQTHRPRSSSAAAVNGEPAAPGEEQDTKCAICDDGDCENTNAIVFCDGCDLAVHQECYVEWRRENDVDAATADAMEYYHYTMRGRIWADSQQAALSMGVTAPDPELDVSTTKVNLILNPPGKKKRNAPPKTVWRLPSGAPVIPQVLYDSVENSLGRFSIRRRKEFAAEACKYWTLKREARRGAALLKRLQLQMETFTSMEITRRNFVGMGAAGRVRLQRRIDFAEQLQGDVEQLKTLCEEIRRREQQKLQDAEMLRDIIDTVYFPIAPLLWPIIERAQALDPKKVFQEGFSVLRTRLSERYYTSMAAFFADFSAVFSETIGLPVAADNAEIEARVAGDAAAKDLILEFKAKKALAKRIIKAVQGIFEDAMRKESELCGRPFEKELRDLDMIFENSMRSRRGSMGMIRGGILGEVEEHEALNGTDTSHNRQDGMNLDTEPLPPHVGHQLTPDEPNGTVHIGVSNAKSLMNGASSTSMDPAVSCRREPPTPPLSSAGQSQPLSAGGIPWYMEPFDPNGSTIHDERWTGRELVRGMSEELSDMDEAELSGLVDDGVVDDTARGETQSDLAAEKLAKREARKKATARRKRNRGW